MYITDTRQVRMRGFGGGRLGGEAPGTVLRDGDDEKKNMVFLLGVLGISYLCKLFGWGRKGFEKGKSR